ncbi:MAG: hypothetical protein FWE08_02225 [Oscillospiraceae bacterium]|nr:hypothetical protein [Oscillospiraceae bacterium]
MYNRYIGNTGEFYRVEETEPISVSPAPPEWPPPPLPPEQSYYPPPPEPRWMAPPLPPSPETEPLPLPEEPGEEKKSRFDLGAMFDMPGSLRGTLRDKLPERIDLGDILLVLVLIYLFLEGDDDDMLIILGVLAVTWVWPLFKRGEE